MAFRAQELIVLGRCRQSLVKDLQGPGTPIQANQLTCPVRGHEIRAVVGDGETQPKDFFKPLRLAGVAADLFQFVQHVESRTGLEESCAGHQQQGMARIKSQGIAARTLGKTAGMIGKAKLISLL